MDHPPSPVLVSKLSRSLQARKRKQKSHVVKNKSSNHVDNVIEKIEDNNDIITNTVKEIENCLQIIKSSESQFTTNDAEILNNNLDSRINTLQEIQSVIKIESDFLDVSLEVQNNFLNYVQSLKPKQEEKKLQQNIESNPTNVSSCKVPSTSNEKENIDREVNHCANLLTKNLICQQNSHCPENNMVVDDFTSDQDLLEDGNDSKISNLVNTIMSGTKVYSSTPVHDKYELTLNNHCKRLNTSYKPKSLNISENSLKSASKLFEDMFESPITENLNTPFRKNVNKKSLNFTESELDEDCFYSDITDTQMNQIVDEAIVTKSEKIDECFNGFESTAVNNSQETKENFKDRLHEWKQSFLELSENSQFDFKGFHEVDKCHNILDNIKQEIERLKNTMPRVQSNKLKRFQQDENISDKYIKKYRYDFCKDITISNDIFNKTIDSNNVLNLEFHSASNKHIEIKNEDLSRAKNLFTGLDDYRTLDNKLANQTSKIPLRSDSNIGEKFVEIFKNPKISEPSTSSLPFKLSTKQKIKQSKLTRMEKHELTLHNLAEMDKSFKAAENVFSFSTDADKNKTHKFSNDFIELHESFNTTAKEKGDCLYESIHEEKNILSKNNINLGFQTASNKQVKINDNSLRKVQNLFKDIDGNSSDGDLIQEPCFRTASNKKCKINKDVLRNVDILFKDIDEFSTDNIEKNKHITAQENTSENSCKEIEFNKTAKSKMDVLKEINATVSNSSSKESLNSERIIKTNKSLPTLFINKENSFEGSDFKTLSVNENFDFQTASSKIIKTNEISLKTAQNLFQDFESNDAITIYNKPDYKSNFGFSTASNKKIETLNEKALEKAKDLFKDIDSDANEIREGSLRKSEKEITPCKKIKTNVKSLETAHNLFKDIIETDDSKNGSFDKISRNTFDNDYNFKKPICSKFGFSTASNKKILVIKESALEKAKNLFKNIDETVENHSKQSSVSESHNFDNSLSKAQNLFKDIFDEFSEITDGNSKSELISNVNFIKPPHGKKDLKQDSTFCENSRENREIYDELENAVMCFKNMDETTLRIPTSNEFENKNKILNSQLESNKNTIISEKDKTELIILNENQTEQWDNMSSKFSTEDKNSKSDSDADETLIEDTDDFTDAASVGSKSDLDNFVLSKDLIKSKQHESNISEIQTYFSDGINLPGLNGLNIGKSNLPNQTYLNEPCISLRQPSSSDLKQLDSEVKKQITNLNTLVSLLEQKRSYITNLMNSDWKNQTVSFTPGILYKEKQKNKNFKISLTSAVNNRLPLCFNNLPTSSMQHYSINLWDITPENACDLHFYLPSPPNPFVITLSDGQLMPSNTNFAGLTEFKIAFETMRGVDKQKIIDGWFDNHFRLIVWKLASMDRQFPNHFEGFFLTPDNLMQQLKYRYDRDIYGNERSAIRKITERDDVPSRRMVLCVSKIIEASLNNYEIELCDGWYSLKTNIDLCLMNVIRRNKIQVGTKLITYGAELLNLPDPCHPLQVPPNACLKIHGNSTRRVKWDTKLGFQKITTPFCTSVQSIQSSGGYVGRILGFVTRIFPLKYIEKMGNEQWVCRCKRAEARRERTFQLEKEKIIEKAHQEAFESLQNQWHVESASIVKQNKNSSDIKKLTCPKQLLALLEFGTDPSSISDLLSKTQLQIVTDYRSKLNSQRQADISSKVQTILNNRGFAKRTVSSILQIIIVDAYKPDLNNHYIIEIWNPDNFILDTLTENSTICFLNLMVSNNRGDNSLKATKQTRYLKVNQQNNINYKFCLRYYTPIRQMQLIEYNPPLKYCDTVGVIVKICFEDNLIKYVWLADAHYRLLRIIYRMDSSNCLAFEGFHVGDIVAVLNLKLSKCLLGQAQALIDFVTYVTKAPTELPDMMIAIEYLHNELPSSFNDFISDCDDKIAQWNSEMSLK